MKGSRTMISYHAALIYAMVLAATADAEIVDLEIETIGEMVTMLPVFTKFERGNMGEIVASCTDLLTEEDGIETAIDMIRQSLPARLLPTAYALACDVVAADGEATQEELRLLEMMRDRMGLDRLTSAAIERGAGARYARPEQED